MYKSNRIRIGEVPVRFENLPELAVNSCRHLGKRGREAEEKFEKPRAAVREKKKDVASRTSMTDVLLL